MGTTPFAPIDDSVAVVAQFHNRSREAAGWLVARQAAADSEAAAALLATAPPAPAPQVSSVAGSAGAAALRKRLVREVSSLRRQVRALYSRLDELEDFVDRVNDRQNQISAEVRDLRMAHLGLYARFVRHDERRDQGDQSSSSS